MQIAELAPDVILASGEAYGSNATVFLDGTQALLVDGLGSRADAQALLGELERRGAAVTLILSTHYFSDHMAALGLLPQARVIAHRTHAETFAGEQFRSDEEAGFWRPADIAVDGGLQLRFGRHRLDVLHAPGHTSSSLAVDVPAEDLLLASDTAVGRIVYVKYGDVGELRSSLRRLIGLRRSRVALGHGGLAPAGTLQSALRYLEALDALVASGRTPSTITLEECLPAGAVGTDWERGYHARNLDVVVERGLFAQA
jgi:cyclase